MAHRLDEHDDRFPRRKQGFSVGFIPGIGLASCIIEIGASFSDKDAETPIFVFSDERPEVSMGIAGVVGRSIHQYASNGQSIRPSLGILEEQSILSEWHEIDLSASLNYQLTGVTRECPCCGVEFMDMYV